MITVVTPFTRIENLEAIANTLKGKANWIVLIDNEKLRPHFPDWVTVKHYDLPEPVDPRYWYSFIPSNRLFNNFIADGVEDETQYMLLCDDDSVEEGFWDKIPNTDVVITSMKRGDNVVQGRYCAYPTDTLIAHPDNMHISRVAGEQLIIKGKILRNFRYGANAVGDGKMVEQVVAEFPVAYVPNAYVLFNYYERGRYNSYKPKPVVLYIGDYFCAANPRLGLSEWEGNLARSLESTGLTQVFTFHFDKYLYATGNRADETLLERIRAIKPDYIVLITYKPLGGDETVIKLETVQEIHRLNIPIITIWGDLEIEDQRNLAKILEPYCWKMIATANAEIVKTMGEKFTYLHVPKDPRVFNNPHKERDIDVVFSGSYGYGRDERRIVMQYLLDNGVKLVHGGSEGGEHLPVEEYADRYKRAKIALSFSQSNGVNVVNARPFEAMMCGAMLLEQESPELAKMYSEGVDYVSWKDKEDLLEKVKYYLEHTEDRERIADYGWDKTKRLYSAEVFWKTVFNKL